MESKKKMEASQSINQSTGLHLVESENLEDLLDINSWLQKYESVDDKLEIKTTEDFDKTVKIMNSLGFKTAQEARHQTEDLDQDIKNKGGLKPWLDEKWRYYEHEKMNGPKAIKNHFEKIEKALETRLSEKKFCRYERALCDFWFKNIDDIDLKKRYSDTMELFDKELELKTLEDFNKTAEIINSLGFKTTQEAHDEAEKFDKAEKNKEELESWLSAKQFCYYEHALNNFFNSIYSRSTDDYGKIFVTQDGDYDSFLKSIDKYVSDKQTNKFVIMKNCLDILVCEVRELLINNCIVSLIQLKNESVLEDIRCKISSFRGLTHQLILSLFSNPDRYNFFLQWHKMLKENLPSEDKQLFYDYLDSCKNKLQRERKKYSYFYEREWVLTGIFIFGIIVLAVVLIIDLPWLFWIGVVLTVAVGICLSCCLLKNYNEIKAINRAIKVYDDDLDKTKSLKELKPEKISTLGFDEKKTILDEEENKQNNSSGSEQTKLIHNFLNEKIDL